MGQLLNSEEIASPGLRQWATFNEAEAGVTAVMPCESKPKDAKDPKAKGKSEMSEKTDRTGGSQIDMQPMRTFATSRFSVDLVTLEANTSCETGVNVARFLPQEELPNTRAAGMKPLSRLPDWRGHLVSPNYFRMINASLHVVVLLASAFYALDLVTNKCLGREGLASSNTVYRLEGFSCRTLLMTFLVASF